MSCWADPRNAKAPPEATSSMHARAWFDELTLRTKKASISFEAILE